LDLAGALSLGTDPELHALKAAGARMADALNAAVVAKNCFGRWMAFRLDDGSSPDRRTLYDTRAAAISHQRHREAWTHFEQVRPASYSADECALTLQYARALYASGYRPATDVPAPIAPVRLEDKAAKLGQLTRHARRNHR
jgi:hypothetical protein